MAFGNKESSRDRSNPAKLFLFRGANAPLESMLRSITMGPGVGEFAYSTTKVRNSDGQSTNYFSNLETSDFTQSLNDLIAAVPDLENITLAVAWHGTDLRAGVCEIRPRVENLNVLPTSPYQWRVGTTTRSTAQLVTTAPFGGAPSDRSIFEALRAIKNRGLRCTLAPFVVMDIPEGNALPDPYGAARQEAYPWRGRITVHPAPGRTGSPNGQQAAVDQVNAFFGSATTSHFGWNAADMCVTYSSATTENSWTYRRFIYHMAKIANAAGADDFLIGSEMVGLTKVLGTGGLYPAVEQLRTASTGCRNILGPNVRISYAADWTEFHSLREGNNITFNMDRLWSHSPINFVGINNYLPMSDWRNSLTNKDAKAGFAAQHDTDYLQSNIEGGEYYDWRYANEENRNTQTRTPIVDDAYGESWVLRQKDVRNWWKNAHYDRTNGVRSTTKTLWVPKSKPIIFTQIGVPAIDKGANQPDARIRYKGTAAVLPYYSSGRTDSAIQRAALESFLRYWKKNNETGFVDYARITAHTWDVRPYPTFPNRSAVFADTGEWQRGHWLTGRLRPGMDFNSGDFGPFAFTDAEFPITRNGIVYQPWPIQHSEITSSGDLDKSELSVKLAIGSGIENEFISFPPSQVVNLTIFQGQMDDEPTLSDYPAVWLGRINAPEWLDNEMSFSCLPVSSSLKRPGLRRNYQLSCPHVLYGPDCKADKRRASVANVAQSISRATIRLTQPLADPQTYPGGLVEWIGASGQKEVRSIVAASATTITVRGTLRDMAAGKAFTAAKGCDHVHLSPRGCSLHQNWANYGGQPLIPDDNPLSQKNQFY